MENFKNFNSTAIVLSHLLRLARSYFNFRRQNFIRSFESLQNDFALESVQLANQV